ncbi:expressed unknown protein [Seminavis robusta]|uniref:SAM domain-containing protein n=1 Tax=Seminavis robusta TaxID=568900 RepID=A0A9N8H718_9STRA|nr:expressed unknown protein [Seminavis robusta]|eukprot:Sro164_g073600.1 n/a (162) ;mRNA; r:46212-46697
MGADQSKGIAQWDVEEVAAAAETLGRHFKPYADTMRGSGIDGIFLASLSTTEVQETLDDLGVESRLHRRVLARKLRVALEGDACTVSCSQSVVSWDSTSPRERRPSARKSMSEKEEDSRKLLELMTAAAQQQMVERCALLQKEAELTKQIERITSPANTAA